MKINVSFLVLIAFSALLTGATGEDIAFELKPEYRLQLKSVGDKYTPLLGILLLEKSDKLPNKVPLTSVPASVKAHAVYWMNKVIRSEWLPEDIEDRLEALKDVKLWEKRDKHGVLVCEWVTDYIMCKYRIRNHGIGILDNGGSLSVLVILPERVDLSTSAEDVIKKCIDTFVNFPSERSSRLTYRLEKEGSLYYGKVLCDWQDKTADLLAGKIVRANSWWQRFTICTDGSFIFMNVPEHEGQLIKMFSRPGPPDRF